MRKVTEKWTKHTIFAREINDKNFMKLGIITAMSEEHAQIAALLEQREDILVDGRTYTTGKLAQHDIVLMQCGIGKVNAAIGATQLIARFSPEAIVNSGCAGGIDAQLGVDGRGGGCRNDLSRRVVRRRQSLWSGAGFACALCWC